MKSLSTPVRTLIAIAVIAMTSIGAVAALAQDEAPDMEAYMAAATPGPHHEALVRHAGSWKTTNKMWMAPGQPPVETSGTAEIEVLMQGRFIQETTKATMMGMPWEGRGVFGYDNSIKKHIGSWYDSFGTTIMSFEGTCDGHCKTVTLTGSYFDPMTKTTKTMKTVTNEISNDEALLTMYHIEDGKDIKAGEVRYERTTTQVKR